jgi:hypothetical protein
MLFWLGASLGAPAWSAKCVDVASEPIPVSGHLDRRSFSDATGRAPADREVAESAYLLELAAPTCFFGDEFLGGEVTISEVHLMVDPDEDYRLFSQLGALVGKDVAVSGKRAFGANSAHHRAPVVVVVATVSEVPTTSEVLTTRHEAAKSAVEAFYLALEVGNGFEAAENIIPRKRR